MLQNISFKNSFPWKSWNNHKNSHDPFRSFVIVGSFDGDLNPNP
jgi:hypothetical protein